MKRRIALLVPTVIAGTALTAMSISSLAAAEECLAKPKGLAPAGKHWYYSTDRKLQRKCWYLDDVGEKTVTRARKPSVAAAPATPAAMTNGPAEDAGARENADARQNVDARAELVEQQRAEQPQAFVAPSAPPPLPVSQEHADATMTRDSTIASRWPEPSDTLAPPPALMPVDPAPAARHETTPVTAPVREPPAAIVAASGSSIDFGLIAAGAIFLVVIGGMIALLRRGRALRQIVQSDMDRGERPWAPVDAEPASTLRRRAPPGRHATIDEIEQLLEARRHAPG